MKEKESKYAIVVDSHGYKKDLVLIVTVRIPLLDNEGKHTGGYEEKEVPYEYTLRDGERLIFDDIQIAQSLKKACWNGQSWDETATPEEIEAALPPLEAVRAAKIAELGAACEAAIHAGVDVETSQGMEHYALTINDQTNIANLAAQAQAGTPVLYHADGQLCRPFAPNEMLDVAAAAIKHKTYHTTYCNHLNVWARRVETREELSAISYGCDLPADLAASMTALLGDLA